MDITTTPARITFPPAVAALLPANAQAVVDASVTYGSLDKFGCSAGRRASIAHTCNPAHDGIKPKGAKGPKWAVKGTARFAHEAYGTVTRCANVNCRKALDFGTPGAIEVAHYRPREAMGAYCGMNLVLTCGTDCNHAVEAAPDDIDPAYRVTPVLLTGAYGRTASDG